VKITSKRNYPFCPFAKPCAKVCTPTLFHDSK